MRHVLFLAYNWPPAGGAGVQRSLKFAKYLPEFGWQPVVVTTTPEAYPVRDESLWADVPEDTPTYRVRGYDINGLRQRANQAGLGKLLTALNLALMLPDAAVFWSRLARPAVLHAAREQQPALIYSSSGPASAHLLAKWAQRHLGLPWLADFRDPWSRSSFTPYYPGYRALNRRIERGVLRAADRLVTVSAPLADDFQRLAGRPDPALVIENGYDEGDVEALPPARTARFTITYTGTFNRLRHPAALVAAVDQLVASGQIPVEKLRIAIAGKDTERYVPNRPPYELLGYLSHDALLELRRQSDLMLLVQNPMPESAGDYSGKLFEYLGSNRPTLAVAAPGNVGAMLIEEARAGVSVPHDADAVAAAILRYYRAWEAGQFDYAPDWAVIRRYTRRNLAGRLAAEFDRLAGARP